MVDTIIGRTKEIELLERYIRSDRAEFIALYGRRRVGKTFLIRQHFNNTFAFDFTGIIEGKRTEQMRAFNQALKLYGHKGKAVNNWLDAFFALQQLLTARSTEEPCVVFIDEMPCMDTPKSGFVHALGHFWNSWGAWQNNLKLIVCGSATSWMVRNIIDNHGGLHDRVTHEMALKPFTLHETEEFFHAAGFPWSRLGILHCYMAVGGVPYYLSLFRPGESPAQGVDRLFFAEGAELKKEYRRLFASLFRNPDPYKEIIKALAQKPSGLTRDELSKRLKINNNGKLGDWLANLIYCDFIKAFYTREKKMRTNSPIFKLTDFYTFFYLTFAQQPYPKPNFWTQMQGTPKINTWLGYAYERVCLAHVRHIKHKLGIEGVMTQSYAWRSREDNPAQIDLLIERADKMINLCEIKYSETEYTLTRDEFLKISRRVDAFRNATKTRYGIIPTLVTTFGVAKGQYADSIHATVVLDDLYQ